MLEHLLKEVATANSNETKREIYEYENKKIITKSDISPLESLNEDQIKASISNSKNNLVIASAGTGKTSTIIGRVYHLLTNNTNPEEIILLTFTAKAGKEMKERLEAFFSKKTVDKIFSGTFHAFGKLTMEKQGKKKLIQDREINFLLKGIYQEKAKSFNIDFTQDKKLKHTKTLLEAYNFYRNTTDCQLIDFYEWIIHNRPQLLNYADFYSEVVEQYETNKKNHDLVDFTDYLIYIQDYYKTNPSSLREVIVDEYQDTNYLQNQILLNMTKNNNTSVFCVGDYDQSIYSFNGSDISIISTFTDKFPQANILALNKNYRSSPSILALAEKIIQNNLRIFPKQLTPMLKDSTVKPVFKLLESGAKEIEFIVRDIKNKSYDYNDIAVLYRSNAMGDRLEVALLENNIPTDRKDSSNFLQTRDIQMFLSLIKLANNKINIFNLYDIFTFSSISENKIKDIYEIGKILGAGNFVQGLTNPNVAFLSNSNDYKRQYLARYKSNKTIESDPKFKLLETSQTVFRTASINEHINTFLNLYILFKQIKNLNDPISVFDEIIKSEYYQYALTKMAKERSTYQEEDISTAKDFYKAKAKTLLRIIKENNTFKALEIKEMLSNTKSDDKFGVKLLSIHASKGLEYSKVFIMGLADKRFPSAKLIREGGSMEEERRLMYVAVTRAKKEVVMTTAQIYGKTKYSISPFIAEGGLYHNIT